MTNKYKTHLCVLPEDDANRQIANGFMTNLKVAKCIHVLGEAGGRDKVIKAYNEDYKNRIQKFHEMRLVMLVDFDNHFENRIRLYHEIIDDSVKNRVFVLGVKSTPEDFRKNMGKSFEEIGQELAIACAEGEECIEDNKNIWYHPMLRHNLPELARMASHVKPFLFRQAEY